MQAEQVKPPTAVLLREKGSWPIPVVIPQGVIKGKKAILPRWTMGIWAVNRNLQGMWEVENFPCHGQEDCCLVCCGNWGNSACIDTDLQCSHFPFHLPLPGCSINRLLKVKPWFNPLVQCSVTWATVTHHHEPLLSCKCLLCFTMSKKVCSYLKDDSGCYSSWTA